MTLKPYRLEPKVQSCDLDLASGVPSQPHASFERWRDAVLESDLRRYPQADELGRTYARLQGLLPCQVAVTAGADDAIDRVFRATLLPGSQVVWTTPGFSMFPRYAQLCGANRVDVPWLDGDFPIDAYLDAVTPTTDLLVLVSPQNPTGQVISISDIKTILTRHPEKTVLVDEAYVEFGGDSALTCLAEHSNLVIARTLSKAYGAAGLRVGFALGQKDMIAQIRAASSPFPVSGPSLRIAREMLEAPATSTTQFVARVNQERAELVDLARALGDRALPSKSNAVLWLSDRADWTYDALASQGIAVRRWDMPQANPMLRVGCPGFESDFARLKQAIRVARQPNLLLLDMDGVIFDVAESYRSAIKRTALYYDVKIDDREIEAAKAAGNANDDWELTRGLLLRAGVEVSLEEVTARFESFYQGDGPEGGLWRNESLLIPREVLFDFARHLPLGIVTGRPRKDAEQSLAQHELNDLFSVVVCREDAALKPSPEPILLAMRQSQIQDPKVWYLGDTPDDVIAAKGAGAVPVGYLPPGSGEKIAQSMIDAGVSRLISSAKDLLELLS